MRTLLLRFALYGGGAFLLSLSKLTAIYSFMRFFPRHIPFDRFGEGMSTLGYISRALFAIPQKPALFAKLQISLEIQEMSMFVSPIVLLGFVSLLFVILQQRRYLWQERGRLVLLLFFFLILSVFFLQLVRGYGVLIIPLERVPILASIHAVVRFLYPFSLFLSILGVIGLQLLVRGSARLLALEHPLVFLSSLLTVGALFLAYGSILSSEDLLRRNVRYDRILELLREHRWFSRPVTQVRWGGTFPFHVLQGSTGVHCYESLFGYRGEEQVTSLTKGLVYEVRSGSFNLLNPVCLQYPKENNCHPGDRIAVTDRENFERFRSGESTTWRLSRTQHISDFISLATFLLMTMKSMQMAVQRLYATLPSC
jgi:hypothetical protein